MLFIFIVVVLVSAGVSPLIRSLRDGTRKKIQEFSHVRLPVKDCGLREEWREEDVVVRRPVPLIFQARKVSVGGSKENFHDGEMDLVALRCKIDLHVD